MVLVKFCNLDKNKGSEVIRNQSHTHKNLRGIRKGTITNKQIVQSATS